MIHDGPDYFPNSCVEFVLFANVEFRQIFAYMRSKEEHRQKEVNQWPKGSKAREIAMIKLEEVESILCYMVANFKEWNEKLKKRRPGRRTNSDLAREVSKGRQLEFKL